MTLADSNSPPPHLAGPPVYTNWIAANAGHPPLGVNEFPLFTDAHITGEVAVGPYEFINTVPIPRIGLIKASVVLRVAGHVIWPSPDMTKTSTDLYHGGSFPEELAALASLAMGIRLRAGNMTRSFEPGGDPKGKPTEWGIGRLTGNLIREDHLRWRLPGAAEGQHSLEAIEVLRNLPLMTPQAASALVRAARLYQDALWLIESEPSLAWLMLVSAVETAASHWRRADGDPVDRLQSSRPDLYSYLSKIGPEVAAEVARYIADSLGSTKKFVDFVMSFLPGPPPTRPPAPYQFDWQEAEIRRVLRKIYGCRSEALHDGKPFPEPMSESPFADRGWAAPSERSIALATSSKGAVWLAKDAPMLFHLFEYIARNALISWWQRGAPDDDSAEVMG